MRTFLLSFIVLNIILICGCSEENPQPLMPQPRPLGADLKTFDPPQIDENQKIPPSIEAVQPTPKTPEGQITLPEALSLALLYNPELKAYSYQVRAAQAARLQASLAPNPDLIVEVDEFGGTGDLRRFEGAETTIALSQLIETAGKKEKRTDLAAQEKQVAAWEYESKRLDVFTEVAKAYAEVLSAQRRLQLNKELLNISEQLVETVSGRVQAGKDAPLDSTKATVVLSDIKIRYRQSKNDLKYARSKLASKWASQPTFKEVSGKFQLPPSVPELESITGLLGNNPDILKWNAEIEKAQAAYRLAKAMGKQDVTVTGGYKRLNEIEDNAFLFEVSVPLGLSDRNQGGIQQAIYHLAAAKQNKTAIQSSLQDQLAESYKDMANAYQEALELKQNTLPAAESVFQASKTGYKQGKLGYLDVLDAQRTLFEARSRYIDVLTKYHKAKADVERLTANSLDIKDLQK